MLFLIRHFYLLPISYLIPMSCYLPRTNTTYSHFIYLLFCGVSSGFLSLLGGALWRTASSGRTRTVVSSKLLLTL